VAPTILVVATLTFVALNVVPGDLAVMLAGVDARAEDVARLRALYGLDRPIVVRYLDWLAALGRGDLGISSSLRAPVAELVAARLPATLSLAFASMAVATAMGIALGSWSARRAGSIVDASVLVASQVGLAVPNFWLGILLLIGFAATLPIFPLQGYAALVRDPWAWARHLALPTLVIGVERGAVLTRLVRASLLEEMGRDYVRTARGKGVGDRAILRRHVLRNAAIPVLTVGGLQLGYLLGGAIIVEQVFGIPGLGRLLLQGIYARDLALVQGAVVVIALLFAGVNVLVDVLYTRLDPRIQYAA